MFKINTTMDCLTFKAIEIGYTHSLEQIKQQIKEIFQVPSHFDFDLYTDDFQQVIVPQKDLFFQPQLQHNATQVKTQQLKIALLNQKLLTQEELTKQALGTFSQRSGFSNSNQLGCAQQLLNHNGISTVQQSFNGFQHQLQQQIVNENEKIADLLIDKVISRKYVCSFQNCRKTFDQAIEMFSHTKTHQNSKTFRCFECGKYYQSKLHLQNHRKSHEEQKQIFCDYPGCNKSYSIMQRLQIHKRTHSGLKPYVCPYESCLKRFNEKGNLKTHIRSHTGLRPYVCNVSGCDSAFITQGHLNDHMKRHPKAPLGETIPPIVQSQKQLLNSNNQIKYNFNNENNQNQNIINILGGIKQQPNQITKSEDINFNSPFQNAFNYTTGHNSKYYSTNTSTFYEKSDIFLKEAQISLKNLLWRKMIEKETGFLPESY